VYQAVHLIRRTCRKVVSDAGGVTLELDVAFGPGGVKTVTQSSLGAPELGATTATSGDIRSCICTSCVLTYSPTITIISEILTSGTTDWRVAT